MKRLVSPFLLLLILLTLSLGWRSTPPVVPLADPRSMTLADGRLFVAGGYTGLHVYDVTDLAAPVKLARIPVEYSAGVAVKDDILYANDAGQLVVMKIGEDNTYTVVARIGVKYRSIDQGIDGNTSGFSCACSTTDYDTAPASPGTGSSYATFAVIDNTLYRVDDYALVVYDITTPAKPAQVASVRVGWDIETLYPTENYLFVGGVAGMYVFDRSKPQHPVLISRIQHVRGCDPVVVSGSTAFVTLRGGNFCGTAPDELLCVSIKEPSTPEIIGEKALSTPWGLAVRDGRLYVSHGQNGYSLLDVSTPREPSVLQTWGGEPTRDFIWADNTLFVMNDNNVTIYDVTDPLAPVLRSRVEPVAPAL